MALSVSDILDPMLKAAEQSLAKDWGKAKDYANPEFQKLATSLVDISVLIAKKTVNKQQANALLNIHKNTTQMVLLAIEGLGIIAVENAINAALKAVSDTVNKAVGFTLI